MYVYMCVPMYVCMYVWMDVWMYGWMDGWMGVCVVGGGDFQNPHVIKNDSHLLAVVAAVVVVIVVVVVNTKSETASCDAYGGPLSSSTSHICTAGS